MTSMEQRAPRRKIYPDITDVLLQALRIERFRLQLTINDIDAIGVQLKSEVISPEQAMDYLHRMGLLDLLNMERGFNDDQREAA